ncbi:MAG: hypothetical protein R6X09_12570 [Bacteroidales bacterium]
MGKNLNCLFKIKPLVAMVSLHAVCLGDIGVCCCQSGYIFKFLIFTGCIQKTFQGSSKPARIQVPDAFIGECTGRAFAQFSCKLQCLFTVFNYGIGIRRMGSYLAKRIILQAFISRLIRVNNMQKAIQSVVLPRIQRIYCGNDGNK